MPVTWVDLIPRLRRIKYERLYLPDQEMAGNLQHLKGILARPIRWDRGYEQYDEMVRHVVAVAEAMGPTESILWRFNSRNRSNPLPSLATECCDTGKYPYDGKGF